MTCFECLMLHYLVRWFGNTNTMFIIHETIEQVNNLNNKTIRNQHIVLIVYEEGVLYMPYVGEKY